jgi:hypothetical protein
VYDLKAGLKAKTILCEITKQHPVKDLNVLGADNITFTGKNFPQDLTRSTIDIVFDDTEKTKCVP